MTEERLDRYAERQRTARRAAASRSFAEDREASSVHDSGVEPLIEVARAPRNRRSRCRWCRRRIAARPPLPRLQDRERLRRRRDVVRPSVFGSLARQANEFAAVESISDQRSRAIIAPRAGQEQQQAEERARGFDPPSSSARQIMASSPSARTRSRAPFWTALASC